MRAFMILYSVAAYAMGFAAILYAIGFVGNFWVPKTVDGPPVGSTGFAILVDLALIALFGLQHSVMARPAFKEWWAQYVPEPIERATYLVGTSIALALLYWLWRPLPGTLWDLSGSILEGPIWTLYGLGWLLVVFSGFLIDHFHLFGMKQVWAHVRGDMIPEKGFVTPLLYKRVRHPIYFGLLLAFWATPAMTMSHLVLALGMTAYIFIGAILEEHDLEAHFGDVYREYKQKVPMLLPSLSKRLHD